MIRKSVVYIMGIFLLVTICAPIASAGNRIAKVRHSLKALDLKRTPSFKELMAAGQLGGQLYPTGDIKKHANWHQENQEFGEAIEKWNRHQYKAAVILFRKYITKHADSPWAAEAMLHIGCDARYNGRYAEADKMFSTIIRNFKGKRPDGAKQLVSKAKMRLGVLKVLQNNPDEAKDIFRDLESSGADWRHRTYAAHWLHRIRLHEADQRAMLNCGVQALAAIFKKAGDKNAAEKVSLLKPESLHGYSLLNLQDIAREYGYDYDAIKININDIGKLPLPAILQIDGRNNKESGHYWVLEKTTDKMLVIYDPQSRRRFEQSPTELASQWDGVTLVQASANAIVPGTLLSEADMAELFGGCCGAPRGPTGLGPGGPNGAGGGGSGPGGSGPGGSGPGGSGPGGSGPGGSGPGGSGPGGSGPGGSGPGGSGPGGSGPGGGSDDGGGNDPCGSPRWEVNMVSMNLYMHDIPMWYNAPIGPSMYIALSYNSQSSIAHHEPFGNKWQFSYATYLVEDTSGNVTVFMPTGKCDIYTPDGQGGYLRPYQVYNTLTKITENHFELRFPDDTVYVYNIPEGTASEQPFLVEIRDVNGQSMTFGYNADIELTTITDALSRTTQLTYNADGLVIQVTDPFGRTTHYEYDASHNLTKIVDMGGYWFEFTYDEDVYLSGITTERGTTHFWIEPADGIVANSDNYPPPGDKMWENYRITVTYPAGEKEEFFYYGGCGTYGCSGYSWHVMPNDYITWQSQEINNYRSGNPKTFYLPATVANGQQDEVSKIIYPDGSFLQYAFDTITGNRNQKKDNLNVPIDYTFNDMGRITSSTNTHGKVTTYTYDPDNQVDLISIQNDLGTVAYTYNDRHQITSLTDRLNHVTRFTYNNFGQLSSIEQADEVLTEFVYNSDHYLEQTKRDGKILAQYTRDPIGRVTTKVDATGMSLDFTYTDLNQVSSVQYPDGKQISIQYAGCCPWLVNSTTDRGGKTKAYEYNARKFLTTVTLPDGTQIHYDYDANGNLIGITDSNNHTTSFEYDANNRMSRKIYADGSALTYEYDTIGRLKRRIDARGVITSYHYDTYYNRVGLSYSDNTQAVSYQYDDFNRLIGATDATGATAYAYDAGSRLASIDGPLANDQLTYQYDAMNRITGIHPESGQSMEMVFDTLGRLSQVQSGSDIFSYSFKSATSPLIDRLTRPNGSYTAYQYDALNRLTDINNKSAAGAGITSNQLTYNDQDLIGSETITTNEALAGFQQGMTSYNYNAVNQLNSASNPDQNFTFDAAGNMTGGYTPDGYIFTATYDGENRLSTIQYSDGAAEVHKYEMLYSFDGFLNTIKKYQSGTLLDKIYIIRSGALALQERDGANAITREFTWGLSKGGGIGGLLSMRQSGQSYDYMYDGKGNVLAVIDSAQNVLASYRYDSFGKLMAKSGTLDQPFLFSTKRYLADVGLNYYGYRYYASAIRRWMNRDPLGEAGGLNLYGFVQNNPANWTDPFGLSVMGDAITGGVGALITGGPSGIGGGMVTSIAEGLTGIPYLGVIVGILDADDLSADDEYSLDQQNEDLDLWRKQKIIDEMNEELDYICEHTGGCGQDPCP